jgi:GTP cyclohydrolase II
MKRARPTERSYVSVTSHPDVSSATGKPMPIVWNASTPAARGPLIATQTKGRNTIGAHGGSYSVYRALAVATGTLDPNYMPDLTNTHPVCKIGPFPGWSKLATIDPFGHMVQESFSALREDGTDVRPTIAVTKAHIELAEVQIAMEKGRLVPDGKILLESGQVNITKAAIEPVWHLPTVAERFGCTEAALRSALFRETNSMYPELITRNDIKVFLPPIGGLTIYIFGDVEAVSDPTKILACRVHDECNGSDVFGSDICTCRPYLIHGIEVCVKTAQEGGAGVIVYFRKEGRSLGEVTKYLVYNRRKRQKGGDSAANYFDCTAQVAGVEDVRFQSMMPDPLHWLGITRIDRFISMSDMKYDAIVSTGIEIVERIPIPPELVPADAHVEIDAKVFAGYHGGQVYAEQTEQELAKTKGREWDGGGADDGAAAAADDADNN